jgi:ribose 5-phosphate isomerase RpiB
MNGNYPDIQWVVAEVLRRLEQLAGPGRPAGPTATGSPATSGPGRARGRAYRAGPGLEPKAAAEATTEETPGTLRLSERLVTLAALDGKLDSTRRLLVPPRAVVTPAVKDELRSRGIVLDVQRSAAAASRRSGLQLVCCTRTTEAERLAAVLTEAVELSCQRQSELSAAVGVVAQALADPAAACILVTDQPLAAVCLANRRPRIRAAAGISGQEAATAIESIGANLLVVDPRQVSAVQWRQIVTHFGHGLPRACPPELNELNCQRQTRG